MPKKAAKAKPTVTPSSHEHAMLPLWEAPDDVWKLLASMFDPQLRCSLDLMACSWAMCEAVMRNMQEPTFTTEVGEVGRTCLCRPQAVTMSAVQRNDAPQLAVGHCLPSCSAEMVAQGADGWGAVKRAAHLRFQ